MLSFGNLTRRRTSLLFFLLNFCVFLYILNQAQKATTNDHHLESMVGSYQFHDHSHRRPNATKTKSASPDALANTARHDGREIEASIRPHTVVTNLSALGDDHGRGKTHGKDRDQSVTEKAIAFENSTDTRKWAYAFLVGGARSERDDTEYFAGLCSVVASAHELRKLGSRADMVLMVQITAESSHEKLTDFEEAFLRKMDIKIVYLPKLVSYELERFYALMLEKFRILKFTNYSRVMYLDYDVMPTCNLDYLFELSDPLLEPSTANSSFRLKENVVIAYKHEPSAGGLFILKPNATDFDQIRRIIHEKEIRSFALPFPHWDQSYGWGHVITPPDYWKTLRGMVETNWSWFGANADQGLLYYWTKYVKKSVSIIIKADVQQWDSGNWDVDRNGTLILRPRQDGDITTVVRNALKEYGCPQTQRLPSPYNDFYHMTGGAKPWYQSRQQLENPDCTTKKKKRECEIQGVWYQSLKEALISVNLLDGFPWDFLSGKPSDLGAAPYNGQVHRYMKAKQKRNWTMYRDDIN